MTYSDRTRRLAEDVKALGAPGDTSRRDQALTALGVVLMLAGIGVAVAGYTISATTSDPLRQSDGRALGPIAITLAVLGLALFLRYSATRFLRFWMARLIVERRTVAPVDATTRDDTSPVATPSGNHSTAPPTPTGRRAGARED